MGTFSDGQKAIVDSGYMSFGRIITRHIDAYSLDMKDQFGILDEKIQHEQEPVHREQQNEQEYWQRV